MYYSKIRSENSRQPHRMGKDLFGRRDMGKKTGFSYALTVSVHGFRRAVSEETHAKVLPNTML